MSAIFKLKNNDTRSYGFAGKMCIAGSGNPTPPDAAKQVLDGVPFRLPGLFELSEDEMFRSFRGVVAAMGSPTRYGSPAIEVLVDGVPTPLTVKDVEGWAADYRSRKGWPDPQNYHEHAREMERSMNRAEDPLEKQQRLAKTEDRQALVEAVTHAVLAVLRPQVTPPAVPVDPPRGRNDERPEAAPAPQRARPRTEEK